MQELDIGRNSIREALKALQAVGIVDIRHGFGMFVGEMSLNGLVDELAFHSRISPQDESNHLAHLTEIREILENGLAWRLIDRHGGADLAGMLSPAREVIERMEEESLVGAVKPETDRLFHDLLYRPLGNPLVGLLLGAFWQVYYQLSDELGTPDEAPEQVARKHRDIYEAVIAQDREAVAAAMSAHFSRHPHPARPPAQRLSPSGMHTGPGTPPSRARRLSAPGGPATGAGPPGDVWDPMPC